MARNSHTPSSPRHPGADIKKALPERRDHKTRPKSPVIDAIMSSMRGIKDMILKDRRAEEPATEDEIMLAETIQLNPSELQGVMATALTLAHQLKVNRELAQCTHSLGLVTSGDNATAIITLLPDRTDPVAARMMFAIALMCGQDKEGKPTGKITGTPWMVDRDSRGAILDGHIPPEKQKRIELSGTSPN